jgi:hypothetical protein
MLAALEGWADSLAAAVQSERRTQAALMADIHDFPGPVRQR